MQPTSTSSRGDTFDDELFERLTFGLSRIKSAVRICNRSDEQKDAREKPLGDYTGTSLFPEISNYYSAHSAVSVAQIECILEQRK